MPVAVLYPNMENSGGISSYDAAYATARAGTGELTLKALSDECSIGQDLSGGVYYCGVMFLEFDTSGIVGSIESVTLTLPVSSDYSTTDFTIRARKYNWGTELEAADWLTAANLKNKRLLASKSTSGMSTGDVVLTSADAFKLSLSDTATRIVIASSRQENTDTPGGAENVALAYGPYESPDWMPFLTVAYHPAGLGEVLVAKGGFNPEDGEAETVDNPRSYFHSSGFKSAAGNGSLSAVTSLVGRGSKKVMRGVLTGVGALTSSGSRTSTREVLRARIDDNGVREAVVLE